MGFEKPKQFNPNNDSPRGGVAQKEDSSLREGTSAYTPEEAKRISERELGSSELKQFQRGLKKHVSTEVEKIETKAKVSAKKSIQSSYDLPEDYILGAKDLSLSDIKKEAIYTILVDEQLEQIEEPNEEVATLLRDKFTEKDLVDYVQDSFKAEYNQEVREKKRSLSKLISAKLGFKKLGTHFAETSLLTGFLASGGMGDVYTAKNIITGKKAAFKTYKSKDVSESLQRRFRKERVSMASVDHPNVVSVYNAGVDKEEGAFFTMEYVEGQDIQELLQSKYRKGIPFEPSSEERGLLDYAIPAANGIIEVHMNGMLHRDIKPGNILVKDGDRSDNGVKITDFGLVASVKKAFFSSQVEIEEEVKSETQEKRDFAREQVLVESITREGGIVGTAYYMAPEALRGQKHSYKSDAWSFGVTLYEMATGEIPFNGKVIPELFRNMSQGLSEDQLDKLATISEPLQEVIAGLLEKKPTNRLTMYKAYEMLKDLRGDVYEGEIDLDKIDAEMELHGKIAMREEKSRQATARREQEKAAKVESIAARREKAKKILEEMDIRSGENLSRRKKKQAKLEATQTYEAAEEVAPTLPPPLIQTDKEALMEKAKKKPGVFKKAWGGIKSFFGRK